MSLNRRAKYVASERVQGIRPTWRRRARQTVRGWTMNATFV